MTEHLFLLPDGRPLTWYEEGGGAPLVLLHGWAMSAAAFREFSGLLSAEYRLLIPDLPGHGRSAPAARNDLSGIADDLLVWLDSLGCKSCSMLGWSLGGMLAMEIAGREGTPVERLVLAGTTPRFTSGDDWAFGLPAGQVRALARNLVRRFEATLAEFFALAFAGEEISAERLGEIRRFAVKRSPLPDRDAALELLDVLAGQDQRACLADIRVPALVLHGEEDRISPVAAGRALAGMLPQGRFSGMAGIAHAPFLTRPRVVGDLLREFLG